jgi:hypothetical protein
MHAAEKTFDHQPRPQFEILDPHEGSGIEKLPRPG